MEYNAVINLGIWRARLAHKHAVAAQTKQLFLRRDGSARKLQVLYKKFLIGNVFTEY